MKKFSTLFYSFLVLVVCEKANAQSGFTDNFNDSNFTANPTWIGQTAKFEINSSKQLQLNDATAQSPAYLVTKSEVINNTTWEFFVQLDFDPSTSNFAKVYLVSNQQNLTGSLDGYFVKIGGQSGTVDDVSLYRQSGTTETLLIDGVDGTVATNPRLMVKVTKDSLSNWELLIDTSPTFSSYVSQGTAIDNQIIRSNFFGVFCRYTSTRSDKFFFDDFDVSGSAFQDTIPPEIIAIEVLTNRSLELSFDELLDPITALNPLNFSVNNGISNPDTVFFSGNDSSKLELGFANEFPNGDNLELLVQNIEDRSGNRMLNTTQNFTFFIPATADLRDIVINELYPDFSSTNGLPDGEFVELYNASNKLFDLADFTLSDPSSTTQLKSEIFRPNDYIIICSESMVNDFAPYGKVMGVASFPTLNNGGDIIQLKDKNNELIDEVNYDLAWYKDNSKQNGGWTLEQVNPFTKCSGFPNFSSSIEAIGGTPGKINSIYDTTPDTSPPKLIFVSILSADSILLQFDENIDSLSLSNGLFIFSDGNTIDTLHYFDNLFNQLLIRLSEPLDSGTIINLSIDGLTDCIGNTDKENDIQLLVPLKSKFNDLVINEVLFNPRTGGSDFVEIYNRSNKILSLKNWSLANFQNDQVSTIREITDITKLIFPDEFLGFTKDLNNIIAEYPFTKAERFIEMSSLPAYNNSDGVVILINETNSIIDRIDYDEDMHFSLLKDLKGVSLERIDPNQPSNERDNFHSASKRENYATPGYENSQRFTSTEFSGEISLEPKTFSPDQDGFQDFTTINYRFNSPGFVANVAIYDSNGRLIRHLVNNELLGNEGRFIWDGTTDDNQKARIGIYIISFEAFHPNGEKQLFKETAVVAAFLD
tara:strand:+ start:557 stop:3178 length:2622 start_codon:yes stop_codon:yes gene_type:complete